ncbi:hypothetical protein RS82_01102 [Microbacterium trichothecenolyticum]|uniref:Uncharacterized protein n=1 Tax=Microbacterium trichothecenolyticum TaxID=69370 RepID=A0A0M2HIL5_MICTR|nr:hypothetical protein RS82_01102 [Microbacterium trichothecenolyticum]
MAYSPTATFSSVGSPVRAVSAITAVGQGTKAKVARIPKFAHCRPTSISLIRVKAALWFIQITAR